MNLTKAIKTRRSVRKFETTSVPQKDLEEIIKLASLAPSASNKQMWHFLVITNKAVIQEAAEVVSQTFDKMSRSPKLAKYKSDLKGMKGYCVFFKNAPVLIVVLGQGYSSNTEKLLKAYGLNNQQIELIRQRPDIQSISAAIQNLLLAAWNKGYGTCWMTGPLIAKSALNKVFKIKKSWNIIALIPLGKPAYVPKGFAKKKVKEIATFVR